MVALNEMNWYKLPTPDSWHTWAISATHTCKWHIIFINHIKLNYLLTNKRQFCPYSIPSTDIFPTFTTWSVQSHKKYKQHPGYYINVPRLKRSTPIFWQQIKHHVWTAPSINFQPTGGTSIVDLQTYYLNKEMYFNHILLSSCSTLV
jgi:hypothetical protein